MIVQLQDIMPALVELGGHNDTVWSCVLGKSFFWIFETHCWDSNPRPAA